MRKPLIWLLAIVAVLGIAAVAGAGILYFGLRTPVVQAAASLQATLIPNTQTKGDQNMGLLVGAVAPGSPAEKAGIVRGDIILEVNGTPINQANRTGDKSLLQNVKAGDTVTLKIKHGDEFKTINVTLGDQDGKPYIGISPAFTARMGMLGMFGRGANGQAFKGMATPGALVVEVTSGGPADKAGLKVGDVILKINNTPIDANNDLAKALQAFKPGDSIKMSLQQKGQVNPVELSVILGSNPSNANQAFLGIRYQMRPLPQPQNIQPPAAPNNNGQGNQNPNAPGPMMPFRRQPNGNAGLMVISVAAGSPAEKAGLQPRDLIIQVNGKAFTNVSDFTNQVKAAKPGDQLILTVIRNNDQAKPVTITATLAANPDNSGTTYLGVTLGGDFRGFPPGNTPQLNPSPKSGGNT